MNILWLESIPLKTLAVVPQVASPCKIGGCKSLPVL